LGASGRVPPHEPQTALRERRLAAIKWVVDEPDSGLARSLATATLEAPDLLPIECASVLWKKAAIGDLTRREAAERLAGVY
jgi:predicted nucleic acid-binding protein